MFKLPTRGLQNHRDSIVYLYTFVPPFDDFRTQRKRIDRKFCHIASHFFIAVFHLETIRTSFNSMFFEGANLSSIAFFALIDRFCFAVNELIGYFKNKLIFRDNCVFGPTRI